MEQKISKSSTRAKSKYNKKNYSRTPISFKHAEMEVLNNHCKKYGYSKNGFVVQAVKEKIQRETNKNFDELLKELQPAEETETAKSAEASGTEKGEE